MRHLFPDTFLASLGRLSLAVGDAPRGARAGAHLSRAAGSSLEFRDYQAYAPGDDLRRVDWNVYGRTRHLFVRQFERPTAVPVHLLVDASASMQVETPSRYATAARAAAAVAAAALASHNPVHLRITSGSPTTAARQVAGRRGLANVLAELARPRTPGGTVAGALRSLSHRATGVLVVISDFFEPAGVDVLVGALRLVPHRLVLLRVTQPGDADPTMSGHRELRDCESDARLNVLADEGARRRYRSAYRAYFDVLDGFAAARGARVAKLDAAADTLPQLEPLFPAGVLSL